ncbi:MAG: chemotaxis protein [Gammaproteobacteria bacterium]|nr:chemotaxis protein [Gammaproteobacteria bacterium]
MADKKENIIVSVATIAADLASVMRIAWEVSLAAKNAKVIAAQAGDQARGFQPITNFIDEIATQAAEGVSRINDSALSVSRIAVQETRALEAYERFIKVAELAKDARHVQSVKPAIEQVNKDLLDYQTQFKKQYRTLLQDLGDLSQVMLAAGAIASLCRVEGARAGEYRESLQVVAEDLDKATTVIKQKITNSYQRLNNMELSA